MLLVIAWVAQIIVSIDASFQRIAFRSAARDELGFGVRGALLRPRPGRRGTVGEEVLFVVAQVLGELRLVLVEQSPRRGGPICVRQAELVESVGKFGTVSGKLMLASRIAVGQHDFFGEGA
ncbi:hypothetical protein ACQP1O_31880 [Nocardia sp. CA-151230]|uniref:hypothetical protein n=1 Tax=Nocardia sp. CA-151230 TaxID=3239982 RepID=UPI003D92DEA5